RRPGDIRPKGYPARQKAPAEARTRGVAARAPLLQLREPVAGAEVVGEAGLGAAGFGGVAVLPADARRQAHEDGFGAAAGLQAEQGAAVVDQVELDVAAPAVELELAFAFAVWRFPPALHDRQVGVEEPVADRAQVAEVGVEVAVQVVEEQPADAARLVAVLQEE